MRLDQYLSKLGIIRRRTAAKQTADADLIKINGQTGKPSKEIKTGDIIQIGGEESLTIEILKIPAGNVRKDERDKYFRYL